MSLADILAAKKQNTPPLPLVLDLPPKELATEAPRYPLTAATIQQQEQKHNGDSHEPHSLTPTPNTVYVFDGDLVPILHKHPSIVAAHADRVLWSALSIRQRLELGKLYREQDELGGEPQEAEIISETSKVKPEVYVPLFDDAPTEAESDPEGQGIAHVSDEAKEEKSKTFSLSVVLNEKQQLGVDFMRSRKSFVYTGAAGTGKTTGCREIVVEALTDEDWLGTHDFKTGDGPGVAVCSYTRRATANIRRALHMDPTLEQRLQHNVTTIHKLLEFAPIFFTSPETGKETMRFEPQRTGLSRPLRVKLLIIEEVSMLGLDLWTQLYDALPAGVMIIFVGDINQLPPVFGKSIMNYALAQLPIVELTDVYRQALDSGIIVNAHHILKGEMIVENKDTQIITGTSKTKAGQEKTSRALGGAFFPELYKAGEYDPELDVILSPWNKQPLGTNSLNSWIAQFLGEQRGAMVNEVFAGRRTMYLAVGDRTMFEKRDGVIKTISHNGNYLGRIPQPAGTDLTRFGVRKIGDSGGKHEDFDAMVAGYANFNVDEPLDEEKKLQASHVITLELDDGEEVTLSAVGDFAEQVFSLGYCLTVHKAQGCEWRKVFLILHEDHGIGAFLTRELLYTAVTRAKEKLVVIAKPHVLAKAIRAQSIKGSTLQEKIQSINSGAQNIGAYPVTKPLSSSTHSHMEQTS